MAQVLVRNVDPDVLARVKKKAEDAGLSLEQHLRTLITKNAGQTQPEILAELDRIRAMTPRQLDDSTPLIREYRDNDEPYR